MLYKVTAAKNGSVSGVKSKTMVVNRLPSVCQNMHPPTTLWKWQDIALTKPTIKSSHSLQWHDFIDDTKKMEYNAIRTFNHRHRQAASHLNVFL